MKRATIHDVAAAAGVSKSTVSRILNLGQSEGASETAHKVRKAAEQLGYVRDASAAHLRQRRTGTVGVVLTNLTDMVRAMFFEEVMKACREHDRFAIAAGVEHGRDEDEAVRLLLHQGVDELILTTTREGDDLPARLRDLKIPYVLALRGDAANPSAVGDDEEGGYMATRHLIELGHRAVAMIGGPAGASSAISRERGYRRAMTEAGLQPAPGYVEPAGFGAQAGAKAAARLIALPERPTAIFAVNDVTAVGAMAELARSGLRVPHDLSIVGYSDIPIAAYLHVPLTTVRVHYDRIARDAVAALVGRKGADTNAERVARPTLTIRESTAPPRG